MRANTWKVFTMMVVLCISGSGREVHGSNKYMNAASAHNVRRVVCAPIVNKKTETTDAQNCLVFSKILTKRKNGKALSKEDIDWLIDAIDKGNRYFPAIYDTFITNIILETEYGKSRIQPRADIPLVLSIGEQSRIIRSSWNSGQ